MNKLYIKDPTVGKIEYFNNLNELSKYLEGLLRRSKRMSKQDYQQHLFSLGWNEFNEMTFIRGLSEEFEIGIVRNNGSLLQTDVTVTNIFNKEEYGM